MLICEILGDSLAAGVAAARHDCFSDTNVGISSGAYVADHSVGTNAERALISLGVNDGATLVATATHLARLRAQVQARRVY